MKSSKYKILYIIIISLSGCEKSINGIDKNLENKADVPFHWEPAFDGCGSLVAVGDDLYHSVNLQDTIQILYT